MGVGYEFLERPDGVRALNRAYKIPWASAPIQMDLQLLMPALRDKQVGMVVTQSTDGWLQDYPAKLLQDDLHCFPPYQAMLVMRQRAITKFPAIESAFEELSGRISDETMRKLNWEVDVKKRDPAEVARQVLKSAGF